ncbi:MAG TPA: tail fiber domain-containing protein [Candidatus Paceibacterota bacterium]|jgi:hypothetical protein
MQRFTALVLLALVACAPAIVSADWTNPTQSPTGGNAAEPINVSNNSQEKVGGMILNSGGATNALLVPYGNVGVGKTPSYKLDIAGNVGATAYFYTSDRSLKTDIKPLSDALANVLALQGVSFTWKKDGVKSIGLIAQDVEKVFPELVHEDGAGLKSVQYGNLVAPLVEAIKEQQKEIESLKAEIQFLKAKVQ